MLNLLICNPYFNYSTKRKIQDKRKVCASVQVQCCTVQHITYIRHFKWHKWPLDTCLWGEGSLSTLICNRTCCTFTAISILTRIKRDLCLTIVGVTFNTYSHRKYCTYINSVTSTPTSIPLATYVHVLFTHSVPKTHYVWFSLTPISIQFKTGSAFL